MSGISAIGFDPSARDAGRRPGLMPSPPRVTDRSFAEEKMGPHPPFPSLYTTSPLTSTTTSSPDSSALPLLSFPCPADLLCFFGFQWAGPCAEFAIDWDAHPPIRSAPSTALAPPPTPAPTSSADRAAELHRPPLPSVADALPAGNAQGPRPSAFGPRPQPAAEQGHRPPRASEQGPRPVPPAQAPRALPYPPPPSETSANPHLAPGPRPADPFAPVSPPPPRGAPGQAAALPADNAEVKSEAPASNATPAPAPRAGPRSFPLDAAAMSFPGLGRSLSSLVPKSGDGNAKLFAAPPSPCGFCAKNGHPTAFCPFLPTPTPRPLDPAWAALLAIARSAPRFAARTPFEEVKATLLAHARASDYKCPFAQAPTSSVFALRKKAAMWAALGTPPSILSWICFGFRLAPIGDIPAIGFVNGDGAAQYAAFLDEELPKRVSAGQFSIVSAGFARIIHPLNVVKKASGGFRMILDCRFLNAFLPDIYFRSENLSSVPAVVPQGAWLFSTDLQDAYYSVPMHEDSRRLFVLSVA